MAVGKPPDPGGEPSGGEKRSRIQRHPRAVTIFLASAIASAIIGTVFSADTFVAAKNAVFGGSGSDDQPRAEVLPSQMLSATRIGLFNIEENGRVDAALVAFGDPSKQRVESDSCFVEWGSAGVEGQFYNLGGNDPCVVGDFCRATVSGRQFATERGLQVADTVSRLHDLYGDASEARRPGAFEYWVLDRGANLCGRDPLGGLVAQTFNGRVTSFQVNFHAGGE